MLASRYQPKGSAERDEFEKVMAEAQRLKSNPIRSLKDLDAAVANIHPNTTAQFIASAHLFSSARMSGSPEKGFCNSEGESWETKGLYITDGSALPSNLGCNPQITISRPLCESPTAS